jgi:hypothetical protein
MQLVHAPYRPPKKEKPDKTGHVPDMSGMCGQQNCIPRYGTQGPSGSQQENAGPYFGGDPQQSVI